MLFAQNAGVGCAPGPAGGSRWGSRLISLYLDGFLLCHHPALSLIPDTVASEQGAPTPVCSVTASGRLLIRPVVAWVFGILGLLSYNWWVLIPLRPGLMRSPNELFSDLEVTGQPFATAMQRADLLSGLLLLGAFLAVGSRSIPDGRRDWLAMMVFAGAGSLGGVFPQVCADGINAVCRNMEWSFRLPLQQYLHIVAGILEFGGITVALLFAFRRTRNQKTRIANAYRYLARAAFVAYPILGLAYLLNRLGGLVEPVFFVGFTAMVLAQLFERTHGLRSSPVKGREERKIRFRPPDRAWCDMRTLRPSRRHVGDRGRLLASIRIDPNTKCSKRVA